MPIKIRRFPAIAKYCALSAGLAVAAFSLAGSVQATPLFWDTNGTTAGSGAATGNWGTDAFWNTDSTGVLAPTVVNTTTADDLTFSAGSNGTAGTVTLTAAEGANSITFSQPGAVTITGAANTLTLSSGAVITVSNATDNMNVLLSGTNIVKSGTGTLVSTTVLNQTALNGLTIENGTFSLGGTNNNNGLGATGSTVTIGSTANNATLLFTAAQSNLNQNVVVGGSGTSTISSTSTGAVTFVPGSFTINNTLHVSVAQAAGSIGVRGAVTGTGPIILDATHVGTFDLRPSNPNVSTNAITVLSGTLTDSLANNNNGWGNGQVTLGDTSGSANVTVSTTSNTQAPTGGFLVRAGSTGAVTFTNVGTTTASIFGSATSAIAIQKNIVLSTNSATTTGTTRIGGALTGTGNITILASGTGTGSVQTAGTGAFLNNTGTITNAGTGTNGFLIQGGANGALGANVTALNQNSGTSATTISTANPTFAGTVNVQLGLLTSSNNGTFGTANVNVGAITGTVSATNFTQLTLGNFQQIDNNATLSLAGGGAAGTADAGFVLLGAGLTEQVGGLVLGGIPQTMNGTYGSTSSGATFPSDEYFSGMGVINLVIVPEPGAFVMLLGGVGMILGFQRLRRSQKA